MDYVNLYGGAREQLLRFVASLQMGTYYAQEMRFWLDPQKPFNDDNDAEKHEDFHAKRRSKVLELAVEMLRFQEWRLESRGLSPKRQPAV